MITRSTVRIIKGGGIMRQSGIETPAPEGAGDSD